MASARSHATSDYRRMFGRVLLGLLVGSVLGIGLGAGLFVVGVHVLRALGGLAEPIASLVPWADPVYTRAALHSLADVHIAGVRIGGAAPSFHWA